MSDAKTSLGLIDSVKNRCHVPESQSTFELENFLDFATEEIRLGIAPFILTMNEDYFLLELRTPLVVGKKEYPIPSRAMGVKLKDLQIRDSNGNYREMTRITIGERFSDSYTTNYNGYSGNLNQFYIKNNKVVLMGEVNSVGSELVFIIYIKPSKLVPDDQVGVISGINRTSGTIVVNQIPEKFNTLQKYDFYKASSPFNVLNIDFPIQSLNVSSNTITVLPENIPSELEVGDHISFANEAMIPQIPEELHVMLAQMVACRVMESQGDTEGLQNALLKLRQMEERAGTLIDNRVTDAPKKVRNRHGLLRGGLYNRYRA